MATVKVCDRRDEGDREVLVSVSFDLVDVLESGALGALGREKSSALVRALGEVTALEADLAEAKRQLLVRLEVSRLEND